MSTSVTSATGWLTLEFWTTSPESVRDLIWVLGAIVGVALLGWRTWAANKSAKAADTQARTAEQGHITDRFTKAVEQLGSDHLEVRVGAIYALERIAKDSARDYWAIIETLATYVRQESLQRRKKDEQIVAEIKTARSEEDAQGAPSAEKMEEHELQIGVDIEAILTIFGRRTNEEVEKFYSKERIITAYGVKLNRLQWYGGNFDYVDFSASSLKGVLFRSVTFKKSKFVQADLSESRLESVTLDDANCSGASFENSVFRESSAKDVNFQQANIKQADLTNAKLQSADFSHADLEGVKLEGANLQGANLENTALENADLRNADLSGAKFAEWSGNELQLERVDKYRREFEKFLDAIGQQYSKDKWIEHRIGMNSFLSSIRDLYGTNLISTDLRGADLRNVTGLTIEQLSFSKIDETTILPPYLQAVSTAKVSTEAVEPP